VKKDKDIRELPLGLGIDQDVLVPLQSPYDAEPFAYPFRDAVQIAVEDFQAAAEDGDAVTGPITSTDNAVPRFDGTDGDTLQNSAVTIDDSGNVAGVGNLTLSGTVDGRDVAADGSKLDGIESGADVTDATNVEAAGAVMESDTSTASMSFVIDEDNMASDSATKVPTQQSVKAYADAIAAGAPTAHAASHTDGTDDIQDATAAQKGLATAAQITKLDGIESGATADQDASDIRGLGFFDTSNDGTGSGLDADLLDGQHAPTGTIVGTTDTQTLTNKTLTSPTITGPTISFAEWTNANHAHTSGSAGGQLNASTVFISGTVPTARLGSGSASSTTFLRGDQTWATVSGGVTSMDDLSDADTTTDPPARSQVLKWNGTNWVPGTAGNTTEFNLTIASFSDGISATQEIGSGTWKAIGALSFTASYTNGPPTSATVQITAGVSAWSSALDMGSPTYAGPTVSTEAVGYPTPSGASHGSITFTLTASDGTDTPTSTQTVTFGNKRFWGVSTTASGYVEADVEGLASSELATARTKSSFTTTAGSGEYVLFAYPTREGTATFTDNDSGFAFAMESPETVSVTNASGYTENYYVYRSTNPNLGAVNVEVS